MFDYPIRMDHDRLFKELLSTFFLDFLRLFVPELAGAIEKASVEPLDKEVFTDVTAGERHDLPVFPIAVFSFDRPRRMLSGTHEVAIAGHDILRFNFQTIQLNQLSWRNFRDTPNPVASARMAKMSVAPEERGKVKWECYRLLATLRLDPAKTRLIGGFIDAYLQLDATQEQVFQQALATTSPQERKAIVELSNPWIRQGHQEGRQEGRQLEAANLALRLLPKRLGELSPERVAAIQALPVEALESLIEAIFEIETDADLAPWLG